MKTALKKIDLNAILYNYRHLKCTYKKNIIAVLKDNAYGCGLIKTAKILQNEENIIFAVKNFAEAIALRQEEIKNPILVLGVFEKNDLTLAKQYSLTVIVSDIDQLPYLKNSGVDFHIKMNISMNRLGLKPIDFINTYYMTYKNSSFSLKGLMTHFATADTDHHQYKTFIDVLDKINYDKSLIIHCLSSNSLFLEEKTNYVRVGMKLYGFLERSSMLKDAINLTAPIIKVIPVKKGEKVGYDLSYTVPEDGYIYILPLGYQNGWGRFKISYAFYDYKYLIQAGKQSMDYTAYFCKYNIKKGEIVELISLNVPLEHLATLNNLSIYQILIQLKDINTTYDI